MTTSPITNPTAYDTPTLSGKPFPGLTRITECNGRQLEWQEQQAPGFSGAFVVFRGEKLVHVTYIVELWTDAHFQAWDPFEKSLAQGKDRRPVATYRLVDLRLKGLKIPQVSLAVLPYQEQIAPGKWGYKVAFQENKRLNLFGGPVKAPQNEREQQIAALDLANKGLRDELAAQQRARRYGK